MHETKAVFPGIAPTNKQVNSVESLSSYIGRIALSYGIRTGNIINSFLAPFLNKKYLLNIAANGGTRFYENSSMILNSGKAAENFCQAVTRITGQEQLEQLTLLPFREEFALRCSLYARRRWCPICYDEWLREEQPIRNLLIWAIKPVTVCVIHAVFLAVLMSSMWENCTSPRKKLPPRLLSPL